MLSLVCLFACNGGGEGDVREELGKVESIMESRPDSAYSLLCDFDKRKLKTVRDTALYRLLWAEGRYKTFHDDTVSDGIDKSVLFFRDAGERRNLMRALFYQGIIRKNAGAYGAAMLSFIESLDYVDSTELFFRGNLHRNLGELANAIGDWPRQEEECRKSLECYRQMDSLVFAEDAQLWYATSLTENGRIDKGIDMMRGLYEKAAEREDNSERHKIASHLGNAYLWKGDYIRSRMSYSVIANESGFTEMEIRDLRFYLIAMVNDDVPEDSVAIVMDAIVGRNGIVPYQYYLKKENYKDAFYSLLNDYEELDKKYVKKTRSDVHFMESNLQNSRIADLKKDLSLTRQRNLWMGTSAVLFLIMTIGISMYFIKRRSIKIKELLALVALLKKKEQESALCISDGKDDSTMRLLKIIFGVLDDLYSDYYKLSDDEKTRKGILARMGQEVENLRGNKALLDGFEHEIDRVTGGLLKTVYSGLGRSLTSDQRRLVVFLYLRISIDAICLLLDINSSSFYNRKSRLLKKLMESSSSRKEELVALLS